MKKECISLEALIGFIGKMQDSLIQIKVHLRIFRNNQAVPLQEKQLDANIVTEQDIQMLIVDKRL